MEIKTRIINDNLIISIFEKINALEKNDDGNMIAPNVILREIIDKAYEEQRLIKVIIDLSETEYIDSMVIGSFVGIAKATKAREGSVVFCGLSDEILSLFKSLGLEHIFSFADNLDDALGKKEKF
jgi:anti-anti-sigma factor